MTISRLKAARQAVKERNYFYRRMREITRNYTQPGVLVHNGKLHRFGLEPLGEVDCPKCGAEGGLSIVLGTVGQLDRRFAAHCESCLLGLMRITYYFPHGIEMDMRVDDAVYRRVKHKLPPGEWANGIKVNKV